ncbi:MipA/OmpV family protein [Aquisalimonas lutea]|uniref:MipA/OmpV family protein n=1 Tax=Aquisalimonas lutea TaxID=1327750 RepID=UPI0025B3D30D|nr:MipA/OmpV family protein [Aquisalimonas lutea]MDN3517114.1 MipA/OmpV family protein [Aquisalimonas lutea]
MTDGRARRQRVRWGNVLRALVLLALLPWTAPGAGETKPLWEIGFGVAPTTFPDYIGSSRQQTYLLPLPYVVYRGDVFRADREGLRGLLVDRPRLSVDVSLDGAVPVSSDDDSARAGMDDLAPVFEAGPSVNWLLYQDGPVRWRIRMPVRAGIAVDSDGIRHVGWRVQPMLSLDLRDVLGGWDIGISAGPRFSSRAYQAYYYDVPAADATDERPAYRAPGGYGGAVLTLSASRRFDSLWAGAFVRYQNLAGARFRDSPLVETRHAVMAGAGIAWILGRSERQVPVSDGR